MIADRYLVLIPSLPLTSIDRGVRAVRRSLITSIILSYLRTFSFISMNSLSGTLTTTSLFWKLFIISPTEFAEDSSFDKSKRYNKLYESTNFAIRLDYLGISFIEVHRVNQSCTKGNSGTDNITLVSSPCTSRPIYSLPRTSPYGNPMMYHH